MQRLSQYLIFACVISAKLFQKTQCLFWCALYPRPEGQGFTARRIKLMHKTTFSNHLLLVSNAIAVYRIVVA